MIAGYTDKGFRLIEFNSDTWHEDEWANWKLIDALLEASLGDVPFPVTGGSANAITLDYTPNQPVVNGTTVIFNLTNAPTGATTVAVDGGTAYPLTILGVEVALGNLQIGDTVKAVFDGTKFNLLSPIRTFSKLQLVSGSSGASPNGDIDNLVIGSDDHAGINILTPATKIGAVFFGDPGSSVQGGISYNHASDLFTLYSNGNAAFTVSATQAQINRTKVVIDDATVTAFELQHTSANVFNIGFSSTTGLGVEADGDLIARQNFTVVGTLEAANIVGPVNVATATGILPVNRGGTGAATAAAARTALGLAALALLDNINNAHWSGADLDIANGGTGASTAAAALTNLGGLALAGGTVTGNIVRSTAGVHPYFNDANMSGGKIFVQATGADPTTLPGDIVYEY